MCERAPHLYFTYVKSVRYVHLYGCAFAQRALNSSLLGEKSERRHRTTSSIYHIRIVGKYLQGQSVFNALSFGGDPGTAASPCSLDSFV